MDNQFQKDVGEAQVKIEEFNSADGIVKRNAFVRGIEDKFDNVANEVQAGRPMGSVVALTSEDKALYSGVADAMTTAELILAHTLLLWSVEKNAHLANCLGLEIQIREGDAIETPDEPLPAAVA